MRMHDIYLICLTLPLSILFIISKSQIEYYFLQQRFKLQIYYLQNEKIINSIDKRDLDQQNNNDQQFIIYQLSNQYYLIMYDYDHKQQREFADEIRYKESKKTKIDKFLGVAITINNIVKYVNLRKYDDGTIEQIIIGNDVSNQQWEDQLKDETINKVREEINHQNRFQRCHFHLQDAATIAMVFEIQQAQMLMDRFMNKFQLNKFQLEWYDKENLFDIESFFKMNIIVTSLVKSTHSLRYIDGGTKKPITAGDQLETIYNQTIEFEYRDIQN
ncbi:hypothetical protein pb186bvf_017806 [Paramecium bursaria]